MDMKSSKQLVIAYFIMFYIKVLFYEYVSTYVYNLGL